MSNNKEITKEVVTSLIESTFNFSNLINNKIQNIFSKISTEKITYFNFPWPPQDFNNNIDSLDKLNNWFNKKSKIVLTDNNFDNFANFLNINNLPASGKPPENIFVSNVNIKGKINIIYVNCNFADYQPEAIFKLNIINNELADDKFDFEFFESKILKEPLSSKSFDKMQLKGIFTFDYPPDVLIFKNSSIKAGCTIMTFKPITIIGYNSDISNIKVVYKNIVWLYNNKLTQKPYPVFPELEQKTCPTQQPCPEQKTCPTQQPCPEIKETSGQNYSLIYWIVIGVLFVLLFVSIYKNFKNTSHKSNESNESD